jgi:tetratricopeptide (TPR) repeat protein
VLALLLAVLIPLPAFSQPQPPLPEELRRSPKALLPNHFNARIADMGREYEDFVSITANGDLANDTPPEALSFNAAMAELKKALAWPEANEVVAIAKGTAGMTVEDARAAAIALLAQGKLGASLVFLLRAHELAPNDQGVLRNLAALALHLGLVNEGYAILLEIERRGMARNPGDAILPEAEVAYMLAYAELRRGRLAEAKAKAQRTLQLEPSLAEARLLLALIHHALNEEEEAKKQFMLGVWRRLPPRLNTRPDAKTPIKEVKNSTSSTPTDQFVMIPLKDLIDLSKGNEGKLPAYRYPLTPEENEVLWQHRAILPGQSARYPRLAKAEHEAAGNIWNQIAVPRLYGELILRMSERKSATDVWRYALFHRLDTMLETEPEVARLWKRYQDIYLCVDKPCPAPLQAAANKVLAEKHKRELALSKRYHPNPTPCRELRELSVRALAEMKPAFNELHSAFIAFHSTWHRHASAIAAQISDPYWHEAFVVDIKKRSARFRENFVTWAYTSISVDSSYYASCPLGVDLPPPEPSPEAELKSCQDVIGSDTLEQSFSLSSKLSGKVSVACDKFGFELGSEVLGIPDNPFVKAGIGPFAGIEFRNKGVIVLNGGLQGELGLGIGELIGLTGAGKLVQSIVIDTKKGTISLVEPRYATETTAKLPGGLGITRDGTSGSIMPAALVEMAPIGPPAIRAQPQPLRPATLQ